MADKPTQKKTVQLKPLVLTRIRCDVDADAKSAHGQNPWLARLYVLWAPLDPAAKEGDPLSKFHLGQTDQRGYLSPMKTELDPDPEKTFPLAEDTEYYFYFIR